MKLRVKDEIVSARLVLWATIEYEAATDPGGAISPGERAETLRLAGIELVQATTRERARLRRFGFSLPEQRRGGAPAAGRSRPVRQAYFASVRPRGGFTDR